MSLLDFRANTYSQNGEDGVIKEILRRVGLDDDSSHWCVEFGAWDGRHLSNTFLLVESRNWNALYIEGDPEKFRALQETARDISKIQPVLSMVGGTKGSGTALDELLAATDWPRNYDLLSIDIDSSDLDVWVRHTDYRPSIVVIEINSGIPPGILQWHNKGTQGNSFSATMRVADSKNYTLVCHTGNLIFVKSELADRMDLDEVDLEFPERLFIWDWCSVAQVLSVKNRFIHAGSLLPQSVKRPVNKILKRK